MIELFIKKKQYLQTNLCCSFSVAGQRSPRLSMCMCVRFLFLRRGWFSGWRCVHVPGPCGHQEAAAVPRGSAGQPQQGHVQ